MKIFYNVLIIVLLIHFSACSDNVPSIIPLEENADENAPYQRLKLSMPDLAGWGEISEIKMTIGDTVEIIATLENEEGEAFTNYPLRIFSERGNFLTENNLLTDHHGQASTLLLATVVGKDKVTATTQQGLYNKLSITVTDDTLVQEAPAELTELPGVISWQTLVKVTLINNIPHFDQVIEALNGQQVKVQGFIVPLEQTEKQEHFLLSINPPTCFFCLPAGPEGLVEVFTKPGIEFSYEPVVMAGTFKVLKQDEMGIYYRMLNAQLMVNGEW
jgi:hypothetical protein